MEARAQSVMSSYNAINGVANAVNHYLLTDILRTQWHYDVKIHDMRVEPGVFDILIGSSSDDIRLRQTVAISSHRNTVRMARK